MNSTSTASNDEATVDWPTARPIAPPGGPGVVEVYEDDGELDVPIVADAACAVGDDPPPFASDWRRGDLVDFDNGRKRLARVRLLAASTRRPGWWATDLPGVDLHEVYFRRSI